LGSFRTPPLVAGFFLTCSTILFYDVKILSDPAVKRPETEQLSRTPQMPAPGVADVAPFRTGATGVCPSAEVPSTCRRLNLESCCPCVDLVAQAPFPRQFSLLFPRTTASRWTVPCLVACAWWRSTWKRVRRCTRATVVPLAILITVDAALLARYFAP